MKIINNYKVINGYSIEEIHQSYCSYDKATAMKIHKLTSDQIDELINTYNWKRPVYKLSDVCRAVKYGRNQASSYPNVDFRMLNNPPRTIYDFLIDASQFDYVTKDVLSLIKHFPAFERLGRPEEEMKFLRKLVWVDTSLAGPVNMVISEFKLLN